MASFSSQSRPTSERYVVSHCSVIMDEQCANELTGNFTSTTSSLSSDENVSQDQFHACAVYIMATFGIAQLIITVVGLVGELHHSSVVD